MTKRNTIFLSFILLLFSFFVFPEVSVAQQVPLNSPDTGIVPCGDHNEPKCDVCHVIILGFNVITFFRNLLVIACIVVISIAGVLYIVSAGNQAMITRAKDALKYSLIGVMVILVGWVVVTFIIRSIALDANDAPPSANGSVGLYVQPGSLWTFSCEGG